MITTKNIGQNESAKLYLSFLISGRVLEGKKVIITEHILDISRHYHRLFVSKYFLFHPSLYPALNYTCTHQILTEL